MSSCPRDYNVTIRNVQVPEFTSDLLGRIILLNKVDKNGIVEDSAVGFVSEVQKSSIVVFSYYNKCIYEDIIYCEQMYCTANLNRKKREFEDDNRYYKISILDEGLAKFKHLMKDD